MKLQLPKTRTFWAAVILAAVSIVLYIAHVFARYVAFLGAIGFLLLLVAFVLLCLGLTLKGL
jgi:hypothetical protein